MSCTGVACTNPNQCNCAGIRGCSCDQYCLCRNQCRTQTLITPEVRYLIFKLSHTRSCLLTTSQEGENDTGNLNENKQGLQESTDSSQGTWLGAPVSWQSLRLSFVNWTSICFRQFAMFQVLQYAHISRRFATFIFCFSHVRSEIDHGSFLKNSIQETNKWKWLGWHHAAWALGLDKIPKLHSV